MTTRQKTKKVELRPIRESKADYDELEKRIKSAFKKHLYGPLVKELALPKSTLKNSSEDLIGAIQTGQISFSRGRFTGRFNAGISRELKRLGAQWDRKQGCWKIPQSSLSIEINEAILASESRFVRMLDRVTDRLRKILPEEIAESVDVGKLFDRAMWKVDREFKESIKGITVAPELPKHRVEELSREWKNNLDLYIKDFAAEEIVKLRDDVKKSVFAGNRYEYLAKTISDRYQVGEDKAKFLARQETNLLMSKFKASRYQEAGIDTYRWGCVPGSKNHPVRPMHKALEGSEWTWKNPPVTDKKGSRNNPGEDYNCRCFARPVVEIKSRS